MLKPYHFAAWSKRSQSWQVLQWVGGTEANVPTLLVQDFMSSKQTADRVAMELNRNHWSVK